MVLRPAHSTEQHRSAAIAVSPQPALGYTARMTDKETTRFSIDWRVAFGLILTTVWITTGCIYLFAKVGWGNFVDLPTADIGSFLEGAFAPLAFLWLVIGHFMQQKEITANTKAIHVQERNARRLELHSRRDTYFKLLTLVQDQLGSIAAFHYISVKGPTGDDTMSMDEFRNLRDQASNGDHALFIRYMTSEVIGLRDDPDAVQQFFFGTEIRSRHTENYVRSFERLLAEARAVDADEIVSDALLFGSAAGRFYRIIQYVQGADPNELSLFY